MLTAPSVFHSAPQEPCNANSAPCIQPNNEGGGGGGGGAPPSSLTQDHFQHVEEENTEINQRLIGRSTVVASNVTGSVGEGVSGASAGKLRLVLGRVSSRRHSINPNKNQLFTHRDRVDRGGKRKGEKRDCGEEKRRGNKTVTGSRCRAPSVFCPPTDSSNHS